MKISMVTVSFNQRAFLQETMDSILSQEYPDLEYIVVDPGSTDGSRELITSYSGRIAHVVFGPDHGAADGLNKGFALATGDIFGFLNSDDLLMPGSLKRIAEFFEQHRECDLGLGNGYIVNGAGERMRYVKARGLTLRRYLCAGSRWLQQSTFFRREAFLRSPGFNVENRTCWDGELLAHMVKQGAQVGYIDADLAGFRIHASSISGTGSNGEVYQRDLRRVFRDVYGREWRKTDEVRRFLYRSEGALIQAGAWLQGLGKRGTA